jgi:glucosamine--fructose-6-phosphate aminotransferase (isomerizing)
MARLCRLSFLTHAGQESDVAKSFTTPLIALFALPAILGKMRGHVSTMQKADHIQRRRHLQAALDSVFESRQQTIT